MKPIRLNKQYLDKLSKAKILPPDLGTIFLLGKYRLQLIGGYNNGKIEKYYLLDVDDNTISFGYDSIYFVLEAYYGGS